MNAELLKLKRTLIWPVLLLSPLLVGLLTWGSNRRAARLAWETYLNSGQSTWAALLYPLMIALIVAQVVGVEHASGGWRLALTQAQPRWVLFGRKFALLALLTLLANLLLAAVLLLTALALPALRGPAPTLVLLQSLGGLWLSSLAITAILYSLAVRFPSFLVPSGFGAAASVVGLLVASSDSGRYWPWSVTLSSVIRPGAQQWSTLQLELLAYCALVSLAALMIGLLDFSRRDR
jgi:lantibiotic transport system permease protein